ncbi:MAG: lysylphosphatidylglycerol synthase transmembrane domain-containing protein [Bosea sp. (in: a-proteobacteria)]
MFARLKDFIWPAIGLAAVIWSVRLLYFKLKAEAATNPDIKTSLDGGNLVHNVVTIARVIGAKMAEIPPHAIALSLASALLAYLALAWYDKLALMHLRKDKGISFPYIATTAFVTYALAHNIGASVVSGGAVRYRAYTAKGLTGAEVAVLVVVCTLTFVFASAMMFGFALLYSPGLLAPLAKLSPVFEISDFAAKLAGSALLLVCVAYVAASLAGMKPVTFKGATIVYPSPKIVILQAIFAPLEIIGAAGIIYFALPEANHPGFFLVLGAFLLSFSAGLISQVPGGVGVMEAVFLALMPDVPASAVFAALLVWRLLYLILPLVISIPVVLLFERARYRAEHPKP